MMDILGEYEKQHPPIVQTAPQMQPAPEHGFFIRLVMRLLGGRIENARQANYVLLGIAAIVFIVSAILFFGATGLGSNTRAFTPQGYKDIPR